MTGFDIRELDDVAQAVPALAVDMSALLQQLTPASRALTADDVASIVRSPATRLVLARDAATGALIGMLTLAVIPLPTGTAARIEDVVVDAGARGQRVGEKLLHVAAILAREADAGFVELTSRPAREAANRLYERMGFERRQTNVYRLALGSEPER